MTFANETNLDRQMLNELRNMMLCARCELVEWIMDSFELSEPAAQNLAFYCWLDLDDAAFEVPAKDCDCQPCDGILAPCQTPTKTAYSIAIDLASGLKSPTKA